MRQQFLEVPFIAFYRKEYVLPELKINDLWRVYKMDELYCKLQQRKNMLKKLYTNMQTYQGEVIMRQRELADLAKSGSRLPSDGDSALKLALTQTRP